MQLNRNLQLGILIATLLYFPHIVLASSSYKADDKFSSNPNVRPVIALQGGYASLKSGESHRYLGTDDEVFIYKNHNNGINTGTAGGFLGIEWVPNNAWAALQIGLEYNYYWNATVKGTNEVGIQGSTMTVYNYRYRIQTQEALAIAKLLTTAYRSFHPYFLVGLGAAVNHSENYEAVTSQTGSINLTPSFSNNTETAFTYSLGLGVDIDIIPNMRAGLAYRFSDFGKSSFKNGQVTFNNYQADVPFELGNSHNYANQLLLSISYWV